MDLINFEYNQPANVLWSVGGSPQPVTFGDAADAIRFIMENLKGVEQDTAWITLDNGSLTLEEIKILYSRVG